MSLPIYHVPQRSKWDVLQDRLSKAEEAVKELKAQLQWMADTPFTANGHGNCSQCGKRLETEMDFAAHFIVNDERYLNIGICPNPKKDW